MNKSKSIQDKVDELNEIVSWFRGDEFVLEQSKAKLSEAAKAANEIESELQNLTNEINEIKQSFRSDTEV